MGFTYLNVMRKRSLNGALLGGPWIIAENYLGVPRWKRNRAFEPLMPPSVPFSCTCMGQNSRFPYGVF